MAVRLNTHFGLEAAARPIEPKRPLTLSGHNNPVRLRNIWLRSL